jgi:hypothetical protein
MTEICEDLIICIRNNYINPLWLKLCNRNYYMKYIEKECIIDDGKIRRLIRKDSQYILDLVLKNNIDKFIKRKKYIYRTKVYKNYIDFMIYYCINNESPKCINVIKNKYGNYKIKSK